MATEYLDLDDAFDAYAEAVEVSVDRAKDALLNLGQLESALARPQNAGAYENADIVRQGATLLWGVAANNPFAMATNAQRQLRPTIIHDVVRQVSSIT